MTATRGRIVLVVAVGTVVLLCALIGIRARAAREASGPQPGSTFAPDTRQSGPATGTRPVGGAAESRRTVASVAPGTEVTGLAFGSQDDGYTLLAKCAPGEFGKRHCSSTLLVTLDGGLSWIERTLPEYGDAELTLAVAGARTVGLGVTGTWWYVSVDEGRTFQRRPYAPLPYELRPGDFGLVCPDPLVRGGCEGPLVEYRPDGVRPVTTGPPLPGPPSDVVVTGTTLWTAGTAGGRAYVATSLDRGTTWQRRDPPPAPGPVTGARLTASADGTDVWLSATVDGGSIALWQFDPSGIWRPVVPVGPVPRLFQLVALGGGVLAATGVDGFGYLTAGGTRWIQSRQGVLRRVSAFTLLGDGTLLVHADEGTVWIGIGAGLDRRWIDVTVLAPTG
jgi:hypothetical protein